MKRPELLVAEPRKKPVCRIVGTTAGGVFKGPLARSFLLSSQSLRNVGTDSEDGHSFEAPFGLRVAQNHIEFLLKHGEACIAAQET